MTPMCKSFAKQRRAPRVSKPLLGCLTALALLSGCAGLPPFPTNRIYEVDSQHKVCGEYAIVDANRLLVKHVKDHPLAKCQGVFGFADKDIPNVLNWSRDAIQKVKNQCR